MLDDFSIYYDLGMWIDIGIALAIFVAFLILRKLFTKYVFKIIVSISKKSNLSQVVVHAFEKPLRTFFILVGLYVSLEYLGLPDEYEIITTAFRTIGILLIGWALYNLTDALSWFFNRLEGQMDMKFDAILIPFLSKLLRFIVIALIATVMLQDWGYNVSGFVAGLGLGGLAFALAAQDTLKNFFGGIFILVDKPFTAGDWIETPSVEGVVEDINFRSTQIRTFSQSLAFVPNSILANQTITNWSRMGRRRVTFNLGVTYSTSRQKLETCVQRIRHMLQNHPEVDQETLFVNFSEFNDSSLDIFIYFFTKSTIWGEWLEVREECNLKMMQILEEEGVSIAFPSRSLYVEQMGNQHNEPNDSDSGLEKT